MVAANPPRISAPSRRCEKSHGTATDELPTENLEGRSASPLPSLPVAAPRVYSRDDTDMLLARGWDEGAAFPSTRIVRVTKARARAHVPRRR